MERSKENRTGLYDCCSTVSVYAFHFANVCCAVLSFFLVSFGLGSRNAGGNKLFIYFHSCNVLCVCERARARVCVLCVCFI